MSDRPRPAGLSRLDPITWQARTWKVVIVVWLAYWVTSVVWIRPLFWIALPSGLALMLRGAEAFPWRIVLILAAPLAFVALLARASLMLLDVPAWFSFAIYSVGCGYFALLFSYPADAWITRLPGWLLGEPFATRSAGRRFQESVEAANEIVHQINADEDAADSEKEINRLANEARRESRRSGTWQGAWAAHATWLEGIAQLFETEPTDDEGRHLSELVAASKDAQIRAIGRANIVDPTGEWHWH